VSIEDAATIAAKWWTDVLRNKSVGSAGNVSDETSLLLTLSKKLSEQPSEIQLLDFQNTLKKNIVNSIRNLECWYEDNPQRGSGLRIVSTTYSPDITLSNSAIEVGINVSIFPIYVTTWIDPDGVRIREGYSGDRVLITE
jgi:hypothetical protein